MTELGRVYAYNGSIRIAQNNVDETLRFIEDTWEKFESDIPFEYSFVDQRYEQFYKSEKDLLSSINVSFEE